MPGIKDYPRVAVNFNPEIPPLKKQKGAYVLRSEESNSKFLSLLFLIR